MLEVNGTCLFGVDDITNKARSVILEEKENLRTEEERLASFRDIPAENSYFVYFYMPACDDCEKVQTYLANMDKEFALEQNRLSKLQVNYVNMGDLDNVPLAHWFLISTVFQRSARRRRLCSIKTDIYRAMRRLSPICQTSL